MPKISNQLPDVQPPKPAEPSGAPKQGPQVRDGSPASAGAPAAARGLLTHSRLSCFRACPRKHYIRYELGIRPAETGFALRVGSAFHAALEASDKGFDPGAAIDQRLDDDYDVAMVAAMFAGHQARYAGQRVEPVASELAFDIPLVNPDTGRSTPIFRLAGVIDRIVELPGGRLALMEYKTTSRDFAPGADYWLRLHMDQQLSIYIIAARWLGYEIDTILYDVTRRPAMRPLRATPEESRKYKKDGTLYASQRDRDETPEEYAARISGDIAFRPEYYFARIEIARLAQDIDACAAEIWQQQQTIRSMQHAGAWYRNPGACFAPFACEYLPICQRDDLAESTPLGFVRADDVHPELTGDATLAG